jgi:hypothetical protein
MFYYYLGILIFAIVAKLEQIDFSSINLIATAFAGGVLCQQFRDVRKKLGELSDKFDKLPCCGVSGESCSRGNGESRDRSHGNHK